MERGWISRGAWPRRGRKGASEWKADRFVIEAASKHGSERRRGVGSSGFGRLSTLIGCSPYRPSCHINISDPPRNDLASRYFKPRVNSESSEDPTMENPGVPIPNRPRNHFFFFLSFLLFFSFLVEWGALCRFIMPRGWMTLVEKKKIRLVSWMRRKERGGGGGRGRKELESSKVLGLDCPIS